MPRSGVSIVKIIHTVSNNLPHNNRQSHYHGGLIDITSPTAARFQSDAFNKRLFLFQQDNTTSADTINIVSPC